MKRSPFPHKSIFPPDPMAAFRREARRHAKVMAENPPEWKREQLQARIDMLPDFYSANDFKPGKEATFSPPAPGVEPTRYIVDPVTGQLWRAENYRRRYPEGRVPMLKGAPPEEAEDGAEQGH